MSIYGYYPNTQELHFLYKIHGEGTAALSSLAPGNELNLFGPLGRGFDIPKHCQHLLIVARGVGMATLAPLAMHARHHGKIVTAILSAARKDLLMSVDYFDGLGCDTITVTDEAGTSAVNNVAGLITGAIERNGVDALYTCGSNRLLGLLKEIGKRHEIFGQVALEQQMACGLGMCHCCVRPLLRDGHITQERVCREGPVFTIDEVVI